MDMIDNSAAPSPRLSSKKTSRVLRFTCPDVRLSHKPGLTSDTAQIQMCMLSIVWHPFWPVAWAWMPGNQVRATGEVKRYPSLPQSHASSRGELAARSPALFADETPTRRVQICVPRETSGAAFFALWNAV